MHSTPNLPPIRLISLETTSASATSIPSDDRQFQIDAFLQAKSFKANTQKAYRHELNRFLQWTNQAWEEVTPRHIAQFKKYLLAQGLAPSSVNRTLTALKSFFQWLQNTESERIQINPATVVGRSQIPASIPKKFDKDEVNALFMAVTQRGSTALRDTAILAVLLDQISGTEVCHLNISDYDGQHLKICRSQDKSPQITALRPFTCQAINQYLQQRREETEEITEQQPLFLSKKCSQSTQRLGYQAVYYIIKAIGQLAGVQELTPHQLKQMGENYSLNQRYEPTEQAPAGVSPQETGNELKEL
jgi:integrase/recombinase XerD